VKTDLCDKIHNIAQISSLINSSLDIREVLNNSLEAVEQFIEVETSSIYELDTETGELFFGCARGNWSKKIENLRLKVGEGIAGWVAETEQSIIVADVARDPRFFPSFDAITGFTTKSILCVPLKAKDRLIGVLELLNKKDGTGFEAEDLDIISILANQIGIASENARLYRKVQEKLLVTVEKLKFTQGKLFQSERLAALGKLAQGVAHEVRNPVAIIGGLAHLLGKRMPAADTGREFLAQIQQAVQRLEGMVREIETFAQMPAPEIAPGDLARVIQEALASFSAVIACRKIRLSLNLPVDMPLIPLDTRMVGQVFHHLIGNALEAMPGGGELSLTAAMAGQSVIITLEDTGTGISPEILPLIFDPFFSTKPQGTGMGLTIAHRIIAEHKGELNITSRPGGGTTVELRLPRWADEEDWGR